MGGGMVLANEGGGGASSVNKFWKWFKNIYSCCLLIFCTVLVMAAIFTRQTTLAQIHPAIAFCVLWLCLAWLSMVEGSQASLVGLPPVNMQLYESSHPMTYKIMSKVNTGDNLDRYLMGRQFLVLALVFIENLCGDPIEGATILNMPEWVEKAFLSSGLALFFMTAMIGKISAQVNASRCMLEYVNNRFAEFTLWVSLLIEMSGLLHICYVVQMLFAWAAKQPLESKEAPRNTWQKIFFWARVLMSGAALGFAFAVTLGALFNGQTTIWDGFPPAAAVVLFFIFMAVVGMLEGMQIAFFAVAKMTEEERNHHPWAKRTCDVLFANDGRNLPGFMVGRQMLVTMCFFILARVTTIKVPEDGNNLWGVSDGLQAFFSTGLLGALITTIVASITWQLVASAFPMAFLSTPITYILLRCALVLDWSGLCQGSWVIALIQRKLCKWKRDEVYIGTAEERAKKNMRDHNSQYNVKAGHMYPGVPCLPADFTPRMNTMEELLELEKELKEHKQDVDNQLADIEEQKHKLQEKEAAAKAAAGEPTELDLEESVDVEKQSTETKEAAGDDEKKTGDDDIFTC